MPALSEEMKRLVERERLGYFATVCEDGSPNLSPKGTTYVLDDERIFFADVRSPQTVANVRRGSSVELNVVDTLARRGFRFKGPASVHDPGSAVFERALERMREAGSGLTARVRAIVVVDVQEARPVVSPAYDDGALGEAEIVRMFRARLLSAER